MSDEKPTAVYRFYGARDELLYIGIALDPEKREMDHKYNSAWYPRAARRTITWYLSRAEAFDAERAAIRRECPEHNRMRYPDTPLATTTWRAPDDLYEQVRREAFESRRPINELLTEAMREWLERHSQLAGPPVTPNPGVTQIPRKENHQ